MGDVSDWIRVQPMVPVARVTKDVSQWYPLRVLVPVCHIEPDPFNWPLLEPWVVTEVAVLPEGVDDNEVKALLARRSALIAEHRDRLKWDAPGSPLDSTLKRCSEVMADIQQYVDAPKDDDYGEQNGDWTCEALQDELDKLSASLRHVLTECEMGRSRQGAV